MLDTPGADGRGDGAFPASYGQQRMWFFERMQPGSALYTVQHTEQLSGSLDADALRRALDALIRRHDALHVTFEERDGRPVQVPRAPAPADVAFHDVADLPQASRSREIEKVFRELVTRGFDLERGPLARFALLSIRPDQQLLMMVVHHIVCDLWSVGVLVRDLKALYGAFRSGAPSPLPEVPLRFRDVIAEQRARYDAGSIDPELRYWRERLAGLPATSELPADRPRPPVQSYRGAGWNFTLRPEVAAPLRDLVRGSGTTLFMGLFAAYAVLLHRHSGQADLAVGTPIANRTRPGFDGMAGLFMNMVVLRLDLAGDPTVRELLAQVRETALGAFDNQDVPLEFLIDDLKPARDPSRAPLFQTLFLFQQGQGGPEPEDGPSHTNGSKFDLTLTLVDSAPRITGTFEYATDLFTAETVAGFAGRFEAIAAAMAADPDARVSRLAAMPPEERRTVVEGWNATDRPVPDGGTLGGLLRRAVADHPAAVAVSFGDESLSYAELGRRAAALSAELRRRGGGPGTRVGLCAERSVDWAVAIVAVLWSGSAFVPLDPSFPPDRLAYMADDAGVALVLTESGPEAKLVGAGAALLDIHAPLPPAGPDDAGDGVGPGDIAYVVYTSGSTGRPKGVVVEHAGVVGFMLAMADAWKIGPGARVLQFTALGFDIGLSEVFLALTGGAALELARGPEMMPGPPLLATLRERRITHVTLPPSALAATAPESLPDLRLVISGGEPCDPEVAARWAAHGPIVNAYGPTEATIYATVGAFDPATGQFPVGRPIPNMRVYVLDRHGAPVPPGVAGEIHIGGAGVARGYLNQPDLTAERFVPDAVSGRPGRLYRTGDLGRFDNHGTLHHLGRLDRQLKVRGYRIEPGEVESVLRRHPQVADAAVLGLGTGPDARLIAYVIARGTPPLAVELRAFAAGLLPDYMAPAAYVTVDAWPKTPNGKIDHAALPRPDSLARQARAAYAAPQGETEARVAAIWRECLGVSAVGGDDNFFDLGGHSLLLVKVHGRLRAELGSALSLVDLFRFPTVRLLAAALKQDAAGHAGAEAAALGRADQRAAQQNAARLRRRRPTGANNA
ncbi:non-ribosomal peptide synthetase [Lichenibacterium dinghuense]|uniref:non-ribosomal peptide synthetase n=1 Tax=Lichenibacterium dinghuense TaxID=2895977 RepID=UPI001F446B88|nr:amino acid adenylation domain-containing protein [Lichenibacterium sp. 6Y81]